MTTRSALLTEHQRLPTSGARGVSLFELEGALQLVIPQLAVDLLEQPPYMNGGDSDIGAPIYQWSEGAFAEEGDLPMPGGEDAEYFRIGDIDFLATASVRVGRSPYDLNTESVLYRRREGAWLPFQRFPTFAAKQWHAFAIGDRHFLALAQGVTVEGPIARHPSRSCLFEWNGMQFVEFQIFDGRWGYNWASFAIGGRHFLAYADHAGPSCLFEWDGAAFSPIQEFAPSGGRAYKYFEADGEIWLAFANLPGESVLFRWDGSRFSPHQTIGGPGGREFALIEGQQGLYLALINFIHGTPAAPKTDLLSRIYRFEKGGLTEAMEFPTFGATDAASFAAEGQIYLAVSNSLTPAVRFREDSVIYRFLG